MGMHDPGLFLVAADQLTFGFVGEAVIKQGDAGEMFHGWQIDQVHVQPAG